MNKKKMSVRDMCCIGIFTAVITVFAQLSIPMPYGVPMTLQTFAIPLAGVILGPKKGAIAALAYIMLGAVGVPVFAGFTGGLGIVLGPTGGFIFSFPLMASAAGMGSVKKEKYWMAAGLVTGAVINYICGMLYFSFVMSSNLYTAFTACVLPFIPADVIKIALTAVVGKQLKTTLSKSGVAV